MNQPSESRTLSDYLAVLRARRGLIVAVTAVALAIGLAYSLVREPTYEATATIEFRNQAEDFGSITPGGVQLPVDLDPSKQVTADASIVTREDVVDRVQASVNTGMSDAELKDSISATVQPDSNLVAITASSGDAERSASLANQFARQAEQARREDSRADYQRDAKELKAALKGTGLDQPTATAYRIAIARAETLSRISDPVEITEPAAVPEAPAAPKPVRDTMLAAILGLLIGVGVAFLRNSLDRRITDAHEIQDKLGLPLVGYVRADALGLAGVARNGDSFVSEDDLEAFRILRTNVDFLVRDGDISSLVVTSSLPEEGKSTVAAWYAYVSAVAGRRTLLVECDFRRPVLADRFGVDKDPGLSEYLSGEATPKEVLRSVEVHGREALDVLPMIPAGANAYQPTEMIGSKRFRAFAEQISRAYEMVVFDSPPLLPVSDTLELIPQADAVLFCVRLDQTTREQANAAMQALRRLPERPIGLVITGVHSGSDDDYYGYYSHAQVSRSSTRAG